MEQTPNQRLYEEGRSEFGKDFLKTKSVLLDGKSEEEQKAIKIRIKREAEIIYDEALRYFADLEKQRKIEVTLVQLPEEKAKEITERIIEAEKGYSPNLTAGGYTPGSAQKPDELRIIEGTTPALLTAEHATTQVRAGSPKEADWGTGGLTEILATDHGTFAITTLGEQTGDANYDDDHQLKTEGGLIIVQRGMRLALSIHGMGGRKFLTEPQMGSKSSGDIAIGIGRNFTPESGEFAEWLQSIAQDLELRADINPWYLALNSEGAPRKKDTLLLRNSFRADKEHTTRSHFQTAASESGLILPVAQIELGPDLRVGPNATGIIPEKIYKAYLLLTQAIAKFAQ